MAISLSLLYFNGTPSPELAARAKRAVDHVQKLAPGTIWAYSASARYKYLVSLDMAGAVADGMAAIRIAPNDPVVLRLASQIEQLTGDWDNALVHAQAAVRLDPRSLPTRRNLFGILGATRKYTEAETLAAEILAEAPGDLNVLQGRAMVHLMQGDLVRAQQIFKPTPPGIERSDLLAYNALYSDLYWVFEEPDQKAIMELTAEDFDGDKAIWAVTLMQLALHRGDKARARELASIALPDYDRQLKGVPNDPQRNLFRGFSLAVLGRKDEAIRAAEKGSGLTPLSSDQTNGAYNLHQLARVYIMLGEHEKALDALEQLVKVPYVLTPGYMRIDPNMVPLRGNPRFERLLQGT
jgi:tetratricopeptide (TPR) repeat protein